MYARVRLRFQKRISELRKIIDPVLNNLLMKQKIKKDVNKTSHEIGDTLSGCVV
jgi:hypothetical protein